MTDLAKAQRPNAPSQRWALVPVALLVSSVAGFSWMALVAVRDPNFALERDYYQKAIHWDQTQAQAATNQRLAYRVSIAPSIPLDLTGHARISMKLTDSSGRAITGAHVLADAFPNAFSDEISNLTLEEQGSGVYAVTLNAKRAGLWELRLSVENAGEHATAIARCELRPGAA